MDVRSVIKAKGYTIDEVAKEMGVTRVTLSQNLSRNPTTRTLRRIADVIGCGVGDFFQDEITMPQGSLVCPHCGKTLHFSVQA